jgi:hypothetical protein
VDGGSLLKAIAEHGFDGPVFAEPFKPEVTRLRELSDGAAAEQVAVCMRRLFAAAGVEPNGPTGR